MSSVDDIRRGDSARHFATLADLIGDVEHPTPLARLQRTASAGAELLVKLEWMNPFGSVKDRAAKWMLQGLEERGELGNREIIEATSGNTGIALAALCAVYGRRMTAVCPNTMPAEKAYLLRSLGATVVFTPHNPESTSHPMDVAMEVAMSMLGDGSHYVMPNQYDNPDNARAHYESTGPEIWNQTGGKIRYFFAGIGTGGTISGVGRYLKERDPSIKVIAIEPVPGHHISGLKNLQETAIPSVFDPGVIDEIVYVDDADALTYARKLHFQEALLAGSSASACIAGAVRWLADHEGEGIAVAIAPDSSQKAIGYIGEILGET